MQQKKKNYILLYKLQKPGYTTNSPRGDAANPQRPLQTTKEKIEILYPPLFNEAVTVSSLYFLSYKPASASSHTPLFSIKISPKLEAGRGDSSLPISMVRLGIPIFKSAQSLYPPELCSPFFPSTSYPVISPIALANFHVFRRSSPS